MVGGWWRDLMQKAWGSRLSPFSPPAQTMARQRLKRCSNTNRAESGQELKGQLPEAPLLPKKGGRKWVGWAWK